MGVRIAAAIVLSLLAFGASGAFAAGTSTTTELTPIEVRTQLASAEELIEKGSYDDAIEVLNGIVETNPKDFNRAERNYMRALRLNPDHKGALEYVGELYLETNRREKAEESLARLEELCPQGCEELEDLREAMDSGGQSSKASW
jgi:tetratricopeptide (TPR) repeat protein